MNKEEIIEILKDETKPGILFNLTEEKIEKAGNRNNLIYPLIDMRRNRPTCEFVVIDLPKDIEFIKQLIKNNKTVKKFGELNLGNY